MLQQPFSGMRRVVNGLVAEWGLICHFYPELIAVHLPNSFLPIPETMLKGEQLLKVMLPLIFWH
jgi:hypothetical protein